MGGIAPPVIGRRVKPPPKNLAINRRKSVTAQSPSNGAPQSPQGAVKGLNRDARGGYAAATEARRSSLTASPVRDGFSSGLREGMTTDPKGKRGSGGAATSLLEVAVGRMKRDASQLDVIRTQAFDAVNTSSGASILHGLLEETVQMFRDSSEATLGGINELVGGVEGMGEKERVLRKEIEEWEETAERLGGQVEEGEERIAELEGNLEEIKGVVAEMDEELRDKLGYVASLEEQVLQLQGDMRALMGRQTTQRSGFQEMMKKEQETIDVALGEIEKLGREGGRKEDKGLVREMQEVMREQVGREQVGRKVGGGGQLSDQQSDQRGGGGVQFSDQQGVNLKPFGGAAPQRAAPQRAAPLKPAQTQKAATVPNIKGVNDPHLPSKKIIIRLNKYMRDNKIDIDEQWKTMDVNQDGFLSFDELFDSLKAMGMGISFADVLVLHKFLAGEKELVSLHDFFEQVKNPPTIQNRKVDMKAAKKKGAISYLDVGKDVEYSSPRYEYNGMAPSVPRQEFASRDSHKKLGGDLATNRNRRRSLEAREGGWNSQIFLKDPAKGGDTFGNVFEAHNDCVKGDHRYRSRSVVYKEGGVQVAGSGGNALPPPPPAAAEVFKKIASYIKYHSIMMADIIHHMDVHGDGKLMPQELKKQILTKIGVQISVAEANFIGKYLCGLEGGEQVNLSWFEDAVYMHKPPKGKF
ncbi:hypothetical protein TrRE_jg11988 [Triparma retinervis]|uniref:EF-hand domain-containing protein n=1 Tax=Triparma retinervis TaxID=2557542 RepID=A0A9W7AQE5_9STRA|nr:hypothetical protein TrRE_jg11988 [Triparma retinervis]